MKTILETILETISDISEPLIKRAMETPADEYAIRLAIKEAAIDGYTAGMKQAHDQFNASLDKLAEAKSANH